MTDALLREIERVIFESHPPLERDGEVDFEGLLKMRSARFGQAREREQVALVQLWERISAELEKDRQIASLIARVRACGSMRRWQSQSRSLDADRRGIVALLR